MEIDVQNLDMKHILAEQLVLNDLLWWERAQATLLARAGPLTKEMKTLIKIMEAMSQYLTKKALQEFTKAS